jgi:hypothetical protein
MFLAPTRLGGAWPAGAGLAKKNDGNFGRMFAKKCKVISRNKR